MAALSDQDDPLAPAKPLATGYAMPDYLSGPAPAAPVAKPRVATPAPAAPVDPSAAPQTHAARAQTPSAAGDASSLIAHFEGFRAVPYWDVNHYRVGYGSDTVTHADGRVEPVTAFTRVTREDAQRDLQRRVGIYQNTIQRTIGPEAWARLSPQAQASITSVAYNYGHVPSQVLAAAQSGDAQKIASSIASLAGANDGVNAKRRQQEAGAVLGTFGLSGPVAAHGAVQNYAMPAGAEGAPYQAQIGQPESPATKPEEKKFDWDSIAKPEEKKYDWDSIAVADGAKKVEEEAGTEGKGFIGRTYDKLVKHFTDPATFIQEVNAERDQNIKSIREHGEFGKGTLSGFAQMATGAGELLGGEVGKAAGRATDYLKTQGSEGGQMLGQGLGLLVPAGEVAKTAKGVQEAEGAISKFGQLAKGTSEGFATGMAGAPVGEAKQNGEEKSLGDRLVEKAPYGVLGAVAGAAPSVIGVAKSGYDKLIGLYSSAHTAAPEAAAEALRGKVLGQSGRVTGEREAAAKALGPQEEAAKAELAYMNEQVARAQSEAEKAGSTKAEAAKVADSKRQELEQAKKSADELIAENAKRPASTPEEMSARMRPVMERDYAALKEKRQIESGFAKAVESDGGKPSIETGALIDKAKALATDTKSDDLAAAASSLAQKLATGEQKAVSIRGAREILTDMHAKLDALDPGAQHRLQPLVDALQEQMEKTHPQMKVARQKYADLSRDLDPYERQGVAARGVKTDLYSKEPVVDSTKLVGAILRSGEAGAEHLGQLIQKDPSLREAAEKYFNGQLFGFSGKVIEPTAQQYGKFLSDNRLALEKSGLLGAFSDLAKARGAMDVNVKAATEAAKTAEKAEKEAAALSLKADQASKMAESRAETSQKAVSELAEQRVKHEAAAQEQKAFEGIVKSDNPKEVAQRSRTFFDKARKDGRIDDEQLSALKREADKLDEAFKTREDAEKALKAYKTFLRNTAIASSAAAAGGALGTSIFLRNVPAGH